MTPASEIVVRWYFDNQGAEAAFTDDLVDTLYEGCGNNEADSVELLGNILATAAAAEKEEPWTSILAVATRLHIELTGVNKAIHNLEQLSLISDAVEKMPPSPIARRITVMKIKECIARLQP